MDEIEELRAERDKLREELEAQEKRKRSRRLGRRIIAVVLVVLACISFVAALTGVWARRNFLDTDRFTGRVETIVAEPAVQTALANRITVQVMDAVDVEGFFAEVLPDQASILAAPLANAIEGFARDQVEAFLASDVFQRLWGEVVGDTHRAAVRLLRGEAGGASNVITTDGGTVTLNLLPIINAVLARVGDLSPDLFGRQITLPDITADDIPEQAIARLEDALGRDLPADFGQITVYSKARLEAAQTALRYFDRGVVLLAILTPVLMALALWVSVRRRRTLLQLCAGVALGVVLLRRVGFKLQEEVAVLPPTEEGRDAATVVVDEFLGPLLTFAGWVLAVAAIVAAVALITGDYPWAVALRRRTSVLAGRVVTPMADRARDESTVAWVRANRDAIMVGGGVVGVILLWVLDLSWFGLLLLLALVVAFEIVVHRIAGPSPPTEGPPPATEPALDSS